MRSPRRRSARGQSIAEYSALLAFVACIVATAFSIANGTFFAGVSGAYGTINSALLTQIQQNQQANPGP